MLVSCSVDWSDSKNNKIVELEKQTTTLKQEISEEMIVFEKKKQCGLLEHDIQAKLDAISKEYANLGKFSIGGIFYSPIKDACLWIRLTDTHATDGSEIVRRALYQFGDDFGSVEPIIGCEKRLDSARGVDTCALWDKELKKIK